MAVMTPNGPEDDAQEAQEKAMVSNPPSRGNGPVAAGPPAVLDDLALQIMSLCRRIDEHYACIEELEEQIATLREQEAIEESRWCLLELACGRGASLNKRQRELAKAFHRVVSP